MGDLLLPGNAIWTKCMATTLLHDMMHKEVEVYVDDMIVKSKEREGHYEAF